MADIDWKALALHLADKWQDFDAAARSEKNADESPIVRLDIDIRRYTAQVEALRALRELYLAAEEEDNDAE